MDEIVELTDELVLADTATARVLTDTLRAWVGEVLPGDAAAAERAVAVAMQAHGRGAPVSQACREGRKFVRSWVAHPSRQGFVGAGDARLAS